MKRTASAFALLGLALLLAACQDPLPSYAYEGTTTTAGVEQPLSLHYEQQGDRLTGEYQVRAVKGSFRGTIDGATVRADLTPGPACAYTFEGTLSGTALTGTYEPADCPGGQGGAWALEQK